MKHTTANSTSLHWLNSWDLLEKKTKCSLIFSKWEYFFQNGRIIRPFWQKYSHCIFCFFVFFSWFSHDFCQCTITGESLPRISENRNNVFYHGSFCMVGSSWVPCNDLMPISAENASICVFRLENRHQLMSWMPSKPTPKCHWNLLNDSSVSVIWLADNLLGYGHPGTKQKAISQFHFHWLTRGIEKLTN